MLQFWQADSSVIHVWHDTSYMYGPMYACRYIFTPGPAQAVHACACIRASSMPFLIALHAVATILGKYNIGSHIVSCCAALIMSIDKRLCEEGLPTQGHTHFIRTVHKLSS